ncbi:MAG: LuxR C-terminal-related transcriptional regulator [Pseudonocardia sp.]|nr:LuxR C-terminal-related transcriptional regulator [Pseudonocardia sp.]
MTRIGNDVAGGPAPPRGPAPPGSRALFDGAVLAARRATGLPVVFGGPVDGSGILLGHSAGMRTAALDGLVVARSTGLGGHAVQVGRPVAVHDYGAARTITHDYDRQVAAEGLVSLVAVPVPVDGEVRAVLYGAARRPGPIADRAVGGLLDAARRLGATLGRAPRPSPPFPRVARAAAGAVFADIDRFAGDIPDPALREEIVDGCARFARAGAGGDGPVLTAREIDILALAAAGCGNAEIAALLGTARAPVASPAVKSHLRTAMRKLGVHTRHAAVSAARAGGLLP